MDDDVDLMVAELLLEAEGQDETLEELFLTYLRSHLTFDVLRRKGMTYQEILALCQRLDAQGQTDELERRSQEADEPKE